MLTLPLEVIERIIRFSPSTGALLTWSLVNTGLLPVAQAELTSRPIHLSEFEPDKYLKMFCLRVRTCPVLHWL